MTILGPHHNAFAIYREHQDGPGMWAGAGALLAIGLKGLEILRRADYQFFELKLGNVCAGKLLQRIQPLFKRSSGRFDATRRLRVSTSLRGRLREPSSGCRLGLPSAP